MKKLNLGMNNTTVSELFEISRSWDNVEAGDLTQDQLAVLNLKNLVEAKEASKKAGGSPREDACFICVSGA